MKTEMIQGRNGYGIPCINHITGDENLTVIVSHGLGSSKESPTAQAVAAAMTEHGIGTYGFDFPAHGESPADGDQFRIENCISDLAEVEAHVRNLNPKAEIAYFSSSFGAYINLIFLAAREHAGRKSFLRCAAVDMPGIVRRGITTEQHAQLDEQGYFMLDQGYVRPLKITRDFLDDLDRHDVFKFYRPRIADISMIHGTADETAPIDDVRHFAKQAGAALIEVDGADHRFLVPGGTAQVIHSAVMFYTGMHPFEQIPPRQTADPALSDNRPKINGME